MREDRHSPLREDQGEGLPAVIICPGYMANIALMEIPWAADLTRLGAAALFLDRRGQGRSGGSLWPQPTAGQRLDDLEPDVAAAIAYLRARQSVVDPNRIAVLGHSDGATAALMAASADWDVHATVAVSASLAPWQFVNHVAPQNLLLIYGSDDHFVLNDTDRTLIARATRGYLAGPGQFGDLGDGSARRLVRVGGRGHVDVLYSEAAHRETLEWLRRSLQSDGDIELAGNRLNWVWSGLAALVLLLVSPFARRQPARADRAPKAPVLAGAQRAAPACFIGRSVALAGVWAVGLLLSPWLAGQGRALVPAQEGAVFAALLIGPTISLVAGALLLLLRRRLFAARAASSPAARQRAACSSARAAHVERAARDAGVGLITAALVCVALQVLLLHHYEVQLNPSRTVLLVLLAGFALPAFIALEFGLRRVAGHSSGRAAGCVMLLATLTAALSCELFERMSVAPGYLVAAVLVISAAYRVGNRSHRPVMSAAFGAVVTGWIGAVVCALY